jgi:hypothetical protein
MEQNKGILGVTGCPSRYVIDRKTADRESGEKFLLFGRDNRKIIT